MDLSAASSPAAAAPRRTRKRVAWSAAVVVALLVVAAVLGRTPSAGRNVPPAQPVAAAAVSTGLTSSATASVSAAIVSSTEPPSEPLTVTATVDTARLPAPATAAAIHNRRSAQAAVTALEALRVAGRAPKTGYSRAQFGDAWTDDVAVDGGHNGCDTRNDILRRDLAQVTVRAGSHGCAVSAGTLADPYTGRTLRFAAGRATTVQIDHVVALSDAWQTGAAALSPQQRQELANDPINLQATASAVNQAKGDGDAATWLPPAKSYRCTYVARQVAVKRKYALWVTPAERQAISTVLTSCGATGATPSTRPAAAPTRNATPAAAPTRNPTPAPAPTRNPTPAATRVVAPVSAVVPAPATSARPATTTHPTAPVPQPSVATTAAEDSGTYYENCSAARAAGAAPLHTGDPGYRTGLDRDHDGIACE